MKNKKNLIKALELYQELKDKIEKLGLIKVPTEEIKKEYPEIWKLHKKVEHLFDQIKIGRARGETGIYEDEGIEIRNDALEELGYSSYHCTGFAPHLYIYKEWYSNNHSDMRSEWITPEEAMDFASEHNFTFNDEVEVEYF